MEKIISSQEVREVKEIQVSRGDIFTASLGEGGKGSEQNGYRPVLILQNDIGNKYSTTTIVAVISTKKGGKLPVHLKVGQEDGLKKDSVIMAEQIRTVSKERLIQKVAVLPEDKMKAFEDRLALSLGLTS